MPVEQDLLPPGGNAGLRRRRALFRGRPRSLPRIREGPAPCRDPRLPPGKHRRIRHQGRPATQRVHESLHAPFRCHRLSHRSSSWPTRSCSPRSEGSRARGACRRSCPRVSVSSPRLPPVPRLSPVLEKSAAHEGAEGHRPAAPALLSSGGGRRRRQENDAPAGPGTIHHDPGNQRRRNVAPENLRQPAHTRRAHGGAPAGHQEGRRRSAALGRRGSPPPSSLAGRRCVAFGGYRVEGGEFRALKARRPDG